MGFKIRVRGVNTYVRAMSKMSDNIHNSARSGIDDAAEYLLEKVVAKIGVYQPIGGDPGGYGAWRKLKYETRVKKLRKYGVGDKPLIASGDLKGSFSVVHGGKGRLSASVGSDSNYLIHHVYGAPGRHVPMRDPILITAKQELNECYDIIEEAIFDEIDRTWGGG